MASQDMTAAPAADNNPTELNVDVLHTSTTPVTHSTRNAQPRDNFPLPRELRGQIYGYLLDGKHNQVKRAGSHRVFYKFHTAIFAVNHCIHNEAEEFLCKHNEFIVVRHDPTRTSGALMPVWIPLVAELGTRSMKYHSLETTLLPYHGVTHSETAVEAWLLLAQDLEKYCLAINLYLSRTMYCPHPRTPMLVLHWNSSLLDCHSDDDGSPLRPHYVRLDFGKNPFHKTSAEIQSAIHSRFRSMHSSSLYVEIYGHVIQTPELTNFQLAAKPGLMCISSLVWRAFWDLDSLKELADSSIHDNELEIADLIYVQIWTTFTSVFRQPPREIGHQLRDLALDTILTLVQLHLKSKTIPPFAANILKTTYSRGNAWFSAFVRVRIFHALLLSSVTSGNPSEPLLDVTIAECIAHLTLPGSDSHQLHDAAILRKCPDHSKKFECKDLPVESCSV